MRAAIPNTLTILRLVLAGLFPFLPPSLWLAVCAVGAATEFLDGYLARRWQAESDFGRVLDPVADKLFVASVLFSVWWIGWVRVGEVLLVMIRDLAVGAGALGMLVSGRTARLGQMRPRPSGKVTTALQFAFLLTLLIWQAAWTWLVVLTALVGLVAAIDYVRTYLAQAR